MTPEQHNKYLGLAHLGYAALHSLMGVFLGVMMVVMVSTLPNSPPSENPPPPALFVFVGCFIFIFSVGWVLPSMIAAYGLLKRKAWARTASIVAGVFAAAQMPQGTAVAVYTFWFAFGDTGRLLYDQQRKSMPAQPEHQYIPPAAPPDWR